MDKGTEEEGRKEGTEGKRKKPGPATDFTH